MTSCYQDKISSSIKFIQGGNSYNNRYQGIADQRANFLNGRGYRLPDSTGSTQ